MSNMFVMARLMRLTKRLPRDATAYLMLIQFAAVFTVWRDPDKDADAYMHAWPRSPLAMIC